MRDAKHAEKMEFCCFEIICFVDLFVLFLYFSLQKKRKPIQFGHATYLQWLPTIISWLKFCIRLSVHEGKMRAQNEDALMQKYQTMQSYHVLYALANELMPTLIPLNFRYNLKFDALATVNANNFCSLNLNKARFTL